MLKKKLSFKKSLRFFLGVFVLTTISLVFYYITPILFAWSGPSDLPPGGNIDLVGIVRNRFNMVEENVSGNVEIDLSQGSVFKHTLTGNVTYTGIIGFSLGKLNSFKLVVEQDATNVYEIAWPGNITWKNYEYPLNLALSSRGIYDFVTLDDGATWYGSVYYDSRGGLQLGSDSGTKPNCTSFSRGMIWVEEGGEGENDNIFSCLKNNSGEFVWEAVFSSWKDADPFGDNSQTVGWSFDNNLNDFYGLNNATVNGSFSYVTGISGQGLFLGSNSTVRYPTNLVQSSNSVRSISLWAYLDSAGSGQRQQLYASGKHGTTNSAFDFEANVYESGVSSKFGIHWWGNGASFSGSSQVIYNQWVHLVVTHAGGNLGNSTKLYINGNYIGDLSSVNQSFSTSLATTHATGRRENLGDLPFYGKVDQVRVFNRELTASEVSKVFSQQR